MDETASQGCFQKFYSIYNYTSEKMKDTTYNFTKNISQNEIKQKLYDTGMGTMSMIKNIGNKVADKGKEFYVIYYFVKNKNSKLKCIFTKAEKKVNYIADKTRNVKNFLTKKAFFG